MSSAQAELLCLRPSCSMYQADLPQKNKLLWAFLGVPYVSGGQNTSFFINTWVHPVVFVYRGEYTYVFLQVTGKASNAMLSSLILFRFEVVTSSECSLTQYDLIRMWAPLRLLGLVLLGFSQLLSLPRRGFQHLLGFSEVPHAQLSRKDHDEAGIPALWQDGEHISPFRCPPHTLSIPNHGEAHEENDEFCQINRVMCLFFKYFFLASLRKLRDGRVMHSNFIRINRQPSLVLKLKPKWQMQSPPLQWQTDFGILFSLRSDFK